MYLNTCLQKVESHFIILLHHLTPDVMSTKASQTHSAEIEMVFVKIVLLVSTCRILMLKRQNKNRNHTAAFIEKFFFFFFGTAS